MIAAVAMALLQLLEDCLLLLDMEAIVDVLKSPGSRVIIHPNHLMLVTLHYADMIEQTKQDGRRFRRHHRQRRTTKKSTVKIGEPESDNDEKKS